MAIQTSIYESFLSASASFKEEAGFLVPDIVNGIEQEYNTLRQGMGLLDYSSETMIKISGEGQYDFMEMIFPKEVEYIPYGQVVNTILCDEQGAIIAIVWILRDDDWFYILSDNIKRSEIVEWLKKYKTDNVVIEDVTEDFECIAIVGPETLDFLINYIDEDVIGLPYMGFEEAEVNDINFNLCRIGYLGEYEYRMILAKGEAKVLLDDIVESAKEFEMELQLCGNSVLNTLMFEMKSVNQKIDIGDKNPLELGLHWMIAFNKEIDFIGKSALTKMKDQGVENKVVLVAFDSEKDLNQIEANTPVFFEEQEIGSIFHTAYSYTEDKLIGQAFLDRQIAWPDMEFEVTTKSGSKEKITIVMAPLFITQTIIKASEE